MAHQGIESASLRLSPEHLGPMEVQISVQNGDASVWFGATQADTRSALQQALPHLRDLFASQGLNLSNAGVFQQAPKDQSRSPRSNAVTSLSAVSAVEAPATTATRLRLGLVDTYA
jgi:flagellar hook-length control protein FliK